MLLTKDYVLVNEIAKQQNIKISNFSPLANNDMLIESKSVIKNSGTMVIDKTSSYLPQYIFDMANKTKHTNLENLFILNELKDSWYLSSKQIEKLGTIIEIENKKFIRLYDEYLELLSTKNIVIYPINKNEIEDKELEDIIKKKQFKQVDKQTFLVWY